MKSNKMMDGRIYETVLYATDLSAQRDFFQNTLGLELIQESELMLVFKVQESFLLIFNPDLSSEPERSVPSHGARGAGHIAFAVPEGEFDDWLNIFRESGVEIEQLKSWGNGKQSIYFRDPAGNSLELTSSGLWGE
jgi:catechol 2,3-dioxygenase-like lactoylglutathione lyase family enzyme